jgi:hypothetical protein
MRSARRPCPKATRTLAITSTASSASSHIAIFCFPDAGRLMRNTDDCARIVTSFLQRSSSIGD